MLGHLPGQQIVDAIDRVIGDVLKHVAQIRFRIEAIQVGRWAVLIRLYMPAARLPARLIKAAKIKIEE